MGTISAWCFPARRLTLPERSPDFRASDPIHDTAHPSRGGAAKPRDSMSQPGCRMECLSMSFWDGSKWVDDESPPKAPARIATRRRPRFTDMIATGVMSLALIGLVVPTISTSAASLPTGSELVSSWTRSSVVKTFAEFKSSRRTRRRLAARRPPRLHRRPRPLLQRAEGPGKVPVPRDRLLVDRSDRPDPRQGTRLHRREPGRHGRYPQCAVQACPGPVQEGMGEPAKARRRDRGRRHARPPDGGGGQPDRAQARDANGSRAGTRPRVDPRSPRRGPRTPRWVT